MYQRVRNLYFGSGHGGLFARTVVGSAGLRIVGMALGFLVGVQLARVLGPAQYGVYGVAMSLISVAMIPTELGLSQLATRESAIAWAQADKSRVRGLFNWALRFVLVNAIAVSIAALAIFLFANQFIGAELRGTLAWGLVLLPLVAVAGICSAVMRGSQRVAEGQLFELVMRPGFLSATLCAAWVLGYGLSPSAAMMLNVVSAAIGLAILYPRLRSLLAGTSAMPIDAALSRRWTSSTIPLAMSEGLRILSGNLAVLVLGALASDSQVGLYRVAMGVYTATTLPSALLNMACSPMLASLNAQGRTEAIRQVNAWMALLLVVAAVSILGVFMVAGVPIMSFAFGSTFADSNTVLLVLLTGELMSAFLGHPTIVLNMLHHERAVTRYSIVAIAINLALCICLVPPLGGVGAAVGVAASQFTWRLLSSIYARRRLGIDSSLLAWRLM